MSDPLDLLSDPESISSTLGSRLKEVRRRRRETIAVVAERTQLTRGFLSKLENGQTSISVGALLRLCNALEISLPELLEWPSGRLIRKAQRERLDFGGEGLEEYLLSPADENRLQVHLTQIAPHGTAGDELYQLPVDVEFVFLVSGTLEVTLDKTTYTLHAGDSLTFTNEQHTFRNPDDAPAEVLWVLSPGFNASGFSRPSI